VRVGYLEYPCVACNEEHGAGFWYYRDRDGRREYLCGAKYNDRPDKADWIALGGAA
jgi:hypothetical protein